MYDSIIICVTLWFGDERGYNATAIVIFSLPHQLWFGDERGYNATGLLPTNPYACCGLVMKEDITQRNIRPKD